MTPPRTFQMEAAKEARAETPTALKIANDDIHSLQSEIVALAKGARK